MEVMLGIDLGTTNSVAAYMKDGRPVIVPNAEGDDLTPSVVAFGGESIWCVGRAAKAQADAAPRTGAGTAGEPPAVVASVKRRMGEPGVIQAGPHAHTPVEIAAMILGKIKADAQAHLGASVDRAVITVPAYFNDAQRRATRDAAALAGLEVIRLVNEPTAAALAYGLDIEEAHTILVWDLGGGTFDVSVLELGDGVFQVKAVNGDTRLGGDDYDARLADMLAEGLQSQWGLEPQRGLRPGGDPGGRLFLKHLAEEAKIRLSTQAEVRVELPQCFAPGNRCSVTVTREAFERATADLTERMVAPARQALADAGLDALDLDRVILVGGMTRMPAVRSLVKRLTGLEPYAHIDPDKVVALGAAVQAGVLAGHIRNVTLVDVTALSLGIETQGGLFSRLIPRNTPIPVSRGKLFTNARDDQTSIEVHVLQGEREMACDNMALGSFELCGLVPQPRGGARVEVAFDIDANGIVQVSARDLHTDRSCRIRLAGAGRPDEREARHALEESARHARHDRRKRAEIESGIRAEALVRSAKALLDDTAPAGAPAVAPGMLRQARVAADALEAALAAAEPQTVEASRKALEAVLRKIRAARKSAAVPAGAGAGASPATHHRDATVAKSL